MQDILTSKLHAYIRQNNPDVLMALEEDGNVTQYLADKVDTIKDLSEQLKELGKPAYIIEEVCMNVLTKDLKPSRFNYICAILEEDFAATHQQLQASATLIYEAINMIAYCKPVFESIDFTEENENDRQLRYAITGAISEYLTGNK